MLGMVVLWAYAFSGLGRQDPADQLDDGTFPAEAQRRCAAARRQLESLPRATHESPPGELADNVEATADILGRMVRELRTLTPAPGHDARIVGLWLDDWDTYVEDLHTYGSSVRSDGYHPFAETDRDGVPLSEAMDALAQVNDMPACETP